MVIDVEPVLFRIGSVEVRWLAVFWVLGGAAALAIWARELGRRGVPPTVVLDLATWIIPSAVVGARLFHVLGSAEHYLLQPVDLLASGGFALWGALAGGGLALLVAARMGGHDPRVLADAAAPSLALGEALGRLGCLIDGSNLGSVTDVPWAVVYPNERAQAPDHVFWRHPTPLYHALAGLIGLAVLWGPLRRRVLRPGALFACWLAIHAVARLGIGFLRLEPSFLLGLQLAQWWALFALAGLAFAMIRVTARSRARPDIELPRR